MEDRIYGFCKACGNYMYRIPGKRHGDGRLDTDEHPVWLLADESEMTDEEMDGAIETYCGCTD